MVFGVGALVWMLPWYFAMPRREERQRSRRTTQERNAATPASGSSGSIAKMIRLRCAWGTTIGHFSGNYFYYFLLAWLPTYLVQEEHLSIGSMSKLTAGIFLLIACTTLLAGWISDRFIAHGVSSTAVRLTVVVGGQIMASSLLGLTLVHGRPLIALGLLAIACIGHGGYASNHWAIAQTLAGPTMAGRWSSLQNGVANFAGIAAPWLAGLIVQTRGSARLAFVVTGGVALLGALSFALLVRRVEPVNWEMA
jgi:sugar phosphate permease